MELGGFHGYHHKLPRLSSSSEMNHQGLGGEQMMNGKAVENHHQMINNGTGRMVAHEILNHTNGNGHMVVNNNAGGTDDNECTVREQDRFMPIANVIRIMRKILPPHAKISDDAKETIQECVSEYISFITGEANERCQREQRKTITAEDVLWAMSKLGFDDYVDPLTLYLHRYREVEGDRGALRGDPLVKRAYDYGGSPSVAIPPGYAPMFHMAPHHHHHHHAGFYGPPHQPANAYLKEASNGGGSNGGSGHQSVVPGFEPYGQQNK